MRYCTRPGPCLCGDIETDEVVCEHFVDDDLGYELDDDSLPPQIDQGGNSEWLDP